MIGSSPKRRGPCTYISMRRPSFRLDWVQIIPPPKDASACKVLEDAKEIGKGLLRARGREQKLTAADSSLVSTAAVPRRENGRGDGHVA
jgi:hypothetical protein